ncbi:uncharacterized protein LOC114534719 [Dendronephthya gigantea]|uniref:uncharacterized protein LOC114534719 n=1 Tax=Dendronephthya gigantea TaxID=151771 RepID=UPI00106C6129|nr:uncharacterized protein LOC114534719 [Dendronephthya gigantea]
MPVSTDSPRFLHFSVFANVKRDHYWSFCNRVVVSFDKEGSSFHCKCCRSRRSCVHKSLVKWALSQWHREALGLVRITSNEEEEGHMEDGNALPDLERDIGGDMQEVLLPNQSGKFYPPIGDNAVKLVRYLFSEKKIPAKLPLSLTVQKDDFITSLCPVETSCLYCNLPLSEPVCITRNAKIVTLKGIIEGVSVYVKFCDECKLPYRYQEFSDGVHNFNDNWILSLGLCDMLRKHLQVSMQVHNAVSRTVEAIESWLQLQPFQLPRSSMLNAYLHFEALTDHSYSFSCVLCGYFPPLLTLDVDKKGVFELAVSELEVARTESEVDTNPEMVDADDFWERVNVLFCTEGY